MQMPVCPTFAHWLLKLTEVQEHKKHSTTICLIHRCMRTGLQSSRPGSGWGTLLPRRWDGSVTQAPLPCKNVTGNIRSSLWTLCQEELGKRHFFFCKDGGRHNGENLSGSHKNNPRNHPQNYEVKVSTKPQLDSQPAFSTCTRVH